MVIPAVREALLKFPNRHEFERGFSKKRSNILKSQEIISAQPYLKNNSLFSLASNQIWKQLRVFFGLESNLKTTHCFLGPRHSDDARPSILPSLLLGTFKLKPPASPLVSDQPSLHGLFESGELNIFTWRGECRSWCKWRRRWWAGEGRSRSCTACGRCPTSGAGWVSITNYFQDLETLSARNLSWLQTSL